MTQGMDNEYLARVFASCEMEMSDLSMSDPEWWLEFEESEVDVGCDREVLSRLLVNAPTGFALGVVFGKILVRQRIASLTGRSF